MAHCVNFSCLDGHGKNALFKLCQACWLVISTAVAVNILWLWSYTTIQFKVSRSCRSIWCAKEKKYVVNAKPKIRHLFFQMWLACLLKNNSRTLYPQVGKKMFWMLLRFFICRTISYCIILSGFTILWFWNFHKAQMIHIPKK